MIHSTKKINIISRPNKSVETNQKPAGGFLIAHFKRWGKL